MNILILIFSVYFASIVCLTMRTVAVASSFEELPTCTPLCFDFAVRLSRGLVSPLRRGAPPTPESSDVEKVRAPPRSPRLS